MLALESTALPPVRLWMAPKHFHVCMKFLSIFRFKKHRVQRSE